MKRVGSERVRACSTARFKASSRLAEPLARQRLKSAVGPPVRPSNVFSICNISPRPMAPKRLARCSRATDQRRVAESDPSVKGVRDALLQRGGRQGGRLLHGLEAV